MTNLESYITLREVSHMLRVSPQTARMYMKDKDMPYHRIGGKGSFRFLESEVYQWIKKQ
tara:strand:- start:2654 stop:2830 length:177 start_codon:yes stop_codon:yes gene_type:complete